MLNKYLRVLIVLFIVFLIPLAFWLRPGAVQKAGIAPPDTSHHSLLQQAGFEIPCKNEHPEWRQAQAIEGVEIDESLACNPDNPYDVAAFVKGVNNISMPAWMNTHLSGDALTKSDDLDHDGDPDIIRIKLEVVELNGSTPDGDFVFPGYNIAPGIQPGLWVFAPKISDMAVKNYGSRLANDYLRAPSPVIRVEQSDKIYITLENTHYFPHTLHLHGVDHPFKTAAGGDNDGVPVTGEMAVFPGDSRTYELQPRHAGTMLYHCHVQTDKHMMLGLHGMFVVEENRPNNWVQTFNIGAGHVRHSSVAVKQEYDREYDLYYQSVDKKLSQIIQSANDPRLIGKKLTREFNMTEADENYFLLNGHSFPYTVRDALMVAQPNENIKLRIANNQRTAMALHFHGHKITTTDYDGVKQPPGQQVTRDVLDIAPAQRVDASLQTQNDGLHSYGGGVWLFHDHVETGTTTDGMSPGGNISMLVYRDLVDEQGMPKIREGAQDPYMYPAYYARQNPVWAIGEFVDTLGDAGLMAPDYLKIAVFGFIVGLIMGLLIYLLRSFRKEP